MIFARHVHERQRHVDHGLEIGDGDVLVRRVVMIEPRPVAADVQCASQHGHPVFREDRGVPTPLLVVVTGMPSSGKTTIAEALARQLRWPLIAKDEIKESLYDTLGAHDVDSSSRLGDAAYSLIFALARVSLASGASLIVEANFFRGQARDFVALPPSHVLQIHCSAPLEVLLKRYASRERHPGHHDAHKIAELPARYASGAHAPLELTGELIELDTTVRVDIGDLAMRIRAQL